MDLVSCIYFKQFDILRTLRDMKESKRMQIFLSSGVFAANSANRKEANIR